MSPVWRRKLHEVRRFLEAEVGRDREHRLGGVDQESLRLEDHSVGDEALGGGARDGSSGPVQALGRAAEVLGVLLDQVPAPVLALDEGAEATEALQRRPVGRSRPGLEGDEPQTEEERYLDAGPSLVHRGTQEETPWRARFHNSDT